LVEYKHYIPHVGNVFEARCMDFSGGSISWKPRIGQDGTWLFT